MFGRRGYDLKGLSEADGDAIYHDKRKPEVATDSDDGIEAINVERYALNSDYIGKESHESLRAAIATGMRKRKKYDYRDYIKGWLSLHGLIIGKVLLFLLLLTATIIVTALSVRASQLRTEEEAEANFDSTLLIKGNTVVAYTSCGPVQGWMEEGAHAFRGIPYALAPEGELRWRLPVTLNRLEHCWNDTLVTRARSEPVNSCWQTYRNGSLDGSEDCLTLDVFAPRTNRSGTKVPIVVLVAAETLGGGGGRGFESPQLLTPKLARATGVVFVRVRFRLGILGFLTASTLTASVHPPRSGNYGLADVHTALRWVKLNAGSFGGDPASITVLGHRAGATLVLALTAIRKPSKLFSRVWLSGPAPFLTTADGELPQKDWLLAEERGDDFVEQSVEKCSSERLDSQEAVDPKACLWGMDAEDLVEGVPEEWRRRAVDLPARDEDPAAIHKWLTVDGGVLSATPLSTWQREGVKVPTVIGTTTHGGSTAELIQRQNWRIPGALDKHIQESSIGAAKLTSETLLLYSTTLSHNATHNAGDPDALALLTAMITDIRSICPLISMARIASSRARGHPLYFYVAESQPGEAGSHSDPSATVPGPAPIGPGADLLEILTHPVMKSEGQQHHHGAIAQMFYSFVWNAPKDELPIGQQWMRMPSRLLLVDRDGKVNSTTAYPTCDYWERKGFVTSKFAQSD